MYADLTKRGLTKEDPLTFHFLLRALADATGEPPYYKKWISIHAKKKAKSKHGRRISGSWFQYNNRWFRMKGRKKLKGGALVYTTHQGVNIPDEESIHFKNCFYWTWKSVDDFAIKATRVPNYKFKECEGGGWYTMTPVYEFKGRFYAPLECSMTMDGEYSSQCNLHLPKEPEL